MRPRSWAGHSRSSHPRGATETRIRIRANRVFPTLDRAEVDFLQDFAADRISADQASDAFDLPAYAITQIADAHRISVADHPYVVAHYVDPQLHKAVFTSFKGALRAASTTRFPRTGGPPSRHR